MAVACRAGGAVWLMLATAFATGLHAQDPPRFTEKVDVARVLIDARATDGRGKPLLGLTAANFDVRIDGRPAAIESVQWVTGALAESSSSAGIGTRPADPRPEGRLVVFLFQKSLERSRIVGFMQMLLNLRGFLAGFTPHDRVAVLSFDSRLRLWLDFTSDMERVRRVVANDVLSGGPVAMNESEYPSLGEAIRRLRPERSYTMESALRNIGEALLPLPGAKTVVVVGHGFGQLGAGGRITFDTDYDDAREVLQRARASVFCLDITNADYHSLEAGLQVVAEDTGGFYERTHIFSQLPLDRLAAALAGHYVLIVEKPDLKRGTHRINVKLKGRSGTLLARNTYID